MKLAEVKNGLVVNVITVDPDNIPEWAEGWPEVTLGSKGWSYDGSNFTPPPAEETPIEELRANASMSRAKFLQACVAAGVIEPSVAEEAASGVWPSAFDGFLTGLSVEQRIEAKATWVDGQRVRRDSPILALIAAEQGVTDEQLDIMFGISGG